MGKPDTAAWLATIDDDTVATIRHEPHKTIVPAALSTGGARAMSVLQQLAGKSPGATAQLVHGDVLGEGGMGVVRAAEQVSLGRQVAVKTLKRRDPAAALDLLREAWVTGSIEHPNVVPVHFVELDPDGMPLVVLKRVDGVVWAQLIDDAAEIERRYGATDRLAWNLNILMQVLNAIRYAHHRGVIHRDLKPSNVMIGDFGEVYLLDWGIAVSLRDDGSGRLPLASEQAQLAGTPAYMAPEMLGRAGSPAQSERTDVYLAGSVLFELIAGRPPHEGTDVLAVIANIIASQPELPADTPAELARICKRAMSEEPAHRFDTAEAMRLALQAYLEHRSSLELAARARERVDELRALIASNKPDPDEVYRVFGACRFGFHAALAGWADNHEATRGLDDATIAVAEYELALDNPAAALTALAGMDEARAPELFARARSRAAERAAHQAELEKLEALSDRDVGRRTRSFLTAIFGLAFVVLPLLSQRGIGGSDIRSLGEEALVLLVLTLISRVWARRTFAATLLNRRLGATALFTFGTLVFLGFTADGLGLTQDQAHAILLLVFGILAAMFAIGVEPWLGVSAPGYFVAFVIAVRYPGNALYLMSAANFLLVANAIWKWRPATWRPTPEERARFIDRHR